MRGERGLRYQAECGGYRGRSSPASSFISHVTAAARRGKFLPSSRRRARRQRGALTPAVATIPCSRTLNRSAQQRGLRAPAVLLRPRLPIRLFLRCPHSGLCSLPVLLRGEAARTPAPALSTAWTEPLVLVRAALRLLLRLLPLHRTVALEQPDPRLFYETACPTTEPATKRMCLRLEEPCAVIERLSQASQ